LVDCSFTVCYGWFDFVLVRLTCCVSGSFLWFWFCSWVTFTFFTGLRLHVPHGYYHHTPPAPYVVAGSGWLFCVGWLFPVLFPVDLPVDLLQFPLLVRFVPVPGRCWFGLPFLVVDWC
jgi:hypothetical protein